MRSDIVPGGIFPDYELPDHMGKLRKLSELQGDDPLILTLARGHYCPKEHQQHLELAAFYPKIAVAYTQVATISNDGHHTLQEFRASVGAVWPFLSDPDRKVQKDLDILEYADHFAGDLQRVLLLLFAISQSLRYLVYPGLQPGIDGDGCTDKYEKQTTRWPCGFRIHARMEATSWAQLDAVSRQSQPTRRQTERPAKHPRAPNPCREGSASSRGLSHGIVRPRVSP